MDHVRDIQKARAAPPPPSPKPEDDPADPLCLVTAPALVAILLNAEREKGSPLTEAEAEVIAIRDNAECIAMPASVAAEMEAKRAYPDILAEAAWAEWQRVRTELGQE